ncbi:PIR-like protein [Plasmodium gallinaceum]|uniref:PIR-like protein n=1 Tax=Plasmodium gallinaceum TaxID=5849 RepID=A0A1J1GVJ3_PLAGA|nr:PIR-like protein [Plasmodium gallinaceum]CRG96551.1 PIR-like protein [Plasmodium gallinaceum]
MMIIYIYLLVCIFQYFYSINFETGKNNLKTELCLRSGRVLAERQQGTRSRNVRSTRDIKGNLKVWLDTIEEGLFDRIEELKSNLTLRNAMDFSQWMNKKSDNITYVLNRVPDPIEKKILNDTLTSWRKLTDKVLLDQISDTYVHRMVIPQKVATTNGLSITSATSNPTSSSNSTSSPTPTQSYNLTPFPISTTSPVLTISPTVLPSASDLSPTSDLSSTTSDSHIHTTTSSTNDTSESPTVFPTNEINSTTSLTNNPTALIPTQHGGGLTGATCTGLLCAPAFAALPISVVLLGVVLVFVLLYMYTPVGKFLGRDKPKKKKAKKRLNEIPMECINSPQLLKVKKKENAKRSVLDRFLRAFGYDKNFPYIDEEIASDQVI